MKPKLLVLELWGLGDLVIATPFLQEAGRHFSVTLLAKPYALELHPRFWPEVEVIPFTAPWTAFHGKYLWWHWRWRDLSRLRRELAARRFDYAVSARWDPRDHLALKLSGARERLGFPRLKSGRYLTRELSRPAPLAHRYEYWRVAGEALGLKLPECRELIMGPSRVYPEPGSCFQSMSPVGAKESENQQPSPQSQSTEGSGTEHLTPALSLFSPPAPTKRGEGETFAASDGSRVRESEAQAPSSWPSPPVGAKESENQHPSPQPSPRLGGARESKADDFNARTPVLLLHSGARLPLRVWPLEHYQDMAVRLRAAGFQVQIACDADQVDWWQNRGEAAAFPRSVAELLALLDRAGAFFGNDSGPGHLAAACGRPTFTLFGPQLHEWFAPLHPASEVVEGRACPYKPCSDYCRFSEPFCLRDITVAEVWPRLAAFAARNLKADLTAKKAENAD